MEIFKASFRHEMISSYRSKSPQLIVAIFLLLTSVSSLIGWLTVRNVTKIYTDIVQQGLTTAPNPFTSVPALYYMRDAVIYIILVGSLMSIVLGAQSSLRDRKSSTEVLIKTRNVNLLGRAMGKLSALGVLLAALEAAVLLASYATIWLIQGHALSGSSMARLAEFGFVSWLLMLAVAAISYLFGLCASSEESALLYPIVSWAVLTFTIPQIITSNHPVALLNPTPAVSTGTGLAQSLINSLSPAMIMEHFKSISNAILGVDSTLKVSLLSLASFTSFVVLALTTMIVVSARSLGRNLNV